jgi:hypothetical protein
MAPVFLPPSGFRISQPPGGFNNMISGNHPQHKNPAPVKEAGCFAHRLTDYIIPTIIINNVLLTG